MHKRFPALQHTRLSHCEPQIPERNSTPLLSGGPACQWEPTGVAVKSSYTPGNLFPQGLENAWLGEHAHTRQRSPEISSRRPCCHQFLRCSHQHTGMQNASVLLRGCSGERKSRGFVVSPPRASAACRRAAAPSPGSTQPRQRCGSRATMAGAVLLGAWQSTGTQK